MSRLQLFIPGVPGNANARGQVGSARWKHLRERKHFRTLAAQIAREQAEAQGWITPEMTVITARHVSPVRRRRDPLGLAERLKGIVDGLADSEVIPDDDELHIQINLAPSVRGETAGIELILTPVEIAS